METLERLSKHERDRLRKAAKPRNRMMQENLFTTGAGKHGKTVAQTRGNDRAALRKQLQRDSEA